MLTLIQKLNDMKIRNKLILAFLLVVLVPVTFVGVLLTSEFKQAALNNAVRETDNSVERIKKLSTDILKIPTEISSSLLNDTRLIDLVNTRYETVYSVVKAYGEYQDIHKYLQSYSGLLSNIRLYVDNPTLVANWCYIQPDEKTVKSFWYTGAFKARDKIGWYYIEDETKSNEKFLSLVRRINFAQYHTSGVLVISINKNYLNSILSQEPFNTMIIDSDNNIVAANQSGYEGKTLKDVDFPANLINESGGTFDKIINGKRSKVFIENLRPDASLNGLKIVSIFSVESIVKESNRILMQGFLIILVSFLVALVLIYATSFLLTNRITKLSRRIKQVAGGDLETVFDIAGGDEIGQLSRQFNTMLASIKQLIYEVEESNRQKNQLQSKQNELRIKMMASQINPHFLFNALESIRINSLLRGEQEIARIIKVLGKLMRKKLEVYREDIPLRNEVEMVQCYLEIEKFRYEDKLTYELNIDPESENVRVPALIIQPLVENAVRHGLGSMDGRCSVYVQTWIADNELHVQVTDNGEGIDEEKMAKIYQLLNDMEDHEGDRIGLHNVHIRLKLTYGEKYGVNIKSKLHEGTQVSFSLPVGGKINV